MKRQKKNHSTIV